MYKPQKNFSPAEMAAKIARTGLNQLSIDKTSVIDRMQYDLRKKNLVKQTSKASGDIDAQILRDVNNAEDLALQVAINFINGPKPFNDEKYARLEKLAEMGFENVDEVNDLLTYKRKLNGQLEIVDQIREYQRVYPMYKFIDMDGVEQLCKKYGLLLTSVDKYKADIPDKNQVDIVNFKVQPRHIREATELNRFDGSEFGSFMSDGDFVYGMTNTRSRRIDMEANWNWMISSLKRERNIGPYFDVTPKDIDVPKLISKFGLPLKAEKEIEYVSGKNLCILAPERMLITSGNLKKGHILLNDPIILQPVKLGYIIITAWGLEAADSSVLNPSHN